MLKIFFITVINSTTIIITDCADLPNDSKFVLRYVMDKYGDEHR